MYHLDDKRSRAAITAMNVLPLLRADQVADQVAVDDGWTRSTTTKPNATSA